MYLNRDKRNNDHASVEILMYGRLIIPYHLKYLTF